MKLTPYKFARIKALLPEGDKAEIERQMKAGKFEPETKARLDKLAHFLQPKRLKKKNGAGGSIGLDRKKKKSLEVVRKLEEAVRLAKEQESMPKPVTVTLESKD